MKTRARITASLAAVIATVPLAIALEFFISRGASGLYWALMPLAGSIALASAAVLAFTVIRGIIIPLKTLEDDMSRSSCGAFPVRFAIRPGDDLGVIKEKFNTLSDSVKGMRTGLRLLMESLPAPALELDSGATIVSANGEAEKALGNERLKGTPFTDFVHKDCCPLFLERLSGVLKGDAAAKDEIRLTVGETDRPFELHAVPVCSAGGDPGAIVLLNDMEETKTLAEEIRKVREEAEEKKRELKKTIKDLEDFALMAVRRELKMKEIRERFRELKEGKEEMKGGERVFRGRV